MKGIITKTVAVLGGASLLAAAGGCYAYRDLVDPCYPERYQHTARKEVEAAFAPQVSNGHVLEQTVWNYHFETGSDKLTAGGVDHLATLARRRPTPDPMIYLQAAQDIPYDPAAGDKVSTARKDLDEKRRQAVKKFMSVQTSGRGLSFEVVVHDPAEPGMAAEPANLAVRSMYTGSRGVLPGGAGAGASNASGGAGASAGGGGGSSGGSSGGSGGASGGGH